MHSRIAARRIALSSRTAARQSVPRHGVRYNASTTGATSASQQMSPFVAAVVGGGVVLAGGYGYYHFSGTRALVQTAQTVQTSIKSAKDTALEKTPPPNEVIQFLRSTAKSYGALIPGASAYIDASFDAIDQLEQTHREEVSAIMNKTYDDLRDVVKNGQVDAQTAKKVYDVFRRQSAELAEVAKKAAAQGLLKSVPGGEKALETAKDIDISSLSRIATSKSEDAKKLMEETYSDVLSVLKEKSEKAKKLAEGAKEDVEKGAKRDDEKDEKKGGEKGKKGWQ